VAVYVSREKDKTSSAPESIFEGTMGDSYSGGAEDPDAIIISADLAVLE
jgi:hypothetical protein